jgi:hypothetical protein
MVAASTHQGRGRCFAKPILNESVLPQPWPLVRLTRAGLYVCVGRCIKAHGWPLNGLDVIS